MKSLSEDVKDENVPKLDFWVKAFIVFYRFLLTINLIYTIYTTIGFISSIYNINFVVRESQ